MFDYIIVGAGSAGCALAARLSEDASVRVALLEAGPPDRSVLIHCPAGLAVMALTGQSNWAFETVPQPGLNGRRGYQPRGKVLGGSSSINAMIYTRGHPADYDHWAAQGNPGWSWNEVLPLFLRAENNEHLHNAWHGRGGPLNVRDLTSPNPLGRRFVQAGVQAGERENTDFNGPEQEGVGAYQVTHREGERFSAAKAYLAPARSRPNLQVITDAQAMRVLLEGRRAVGVEYRQGGSLQTVHAAREVILSAGALQSPQLLMLSGIGPGEHLQSMGIEVRHALPGVGQNLHDHVDVVAVVHAPGATDSLGLTAGFVPRSVRGILEWRRQRTGLLTTNFAEAGGFIRSQPQEPLPDLQLHFVTGKLIDHGRKPAIGYGYSCHVCLLRPMSRGSVSLGSANPSAPPRIDPNVLAERDDLERMVRGFRRMREILRQPALAELGGRESEASARAQDDTALEQFVRDHADTIYHPVGTCRMGPGPMDVVDAELRVHGIDGLRVADASIMPRIVGGNTNAPAVMIGEKAAELLRQNRSLSNP